ncbi:MAG TPA: hypothetical protein VLV54_05350, partial [Thermoanaerobaculia bacterium]|nr:hypothetical protein [Thermoanaerobaculia bacterium]
RALVPVLWPWSDVTFDIDFGVWHPSTFTGSLICGFVGVFFLFASINLLNALALIWRQLATSMLGSARFTAIPPSSSLPGVTGGVGAGCCLSGV